MKATVDQDLCIGCGYCESVCPSVFRLNFENKSEVIIVLIPADDLVSAKDAETNCPVSAIIISEVID